MMNLYLRANIIQKIEVDILEFVYSKW